MAQKEGESAQHPVDGIEQIRDIIFGEQIATFDKKLAELDRKLATLKNDLKNLEKTQTETATMVTDNLEALKNSTFDKNKIHEIIEQMKNEIDQKINALGESKVDKSQIGEVFIEWGMKVKQTHSK